MAAVLAGPAIIPASALGAGGAVAPSERIVMGGIGIGGRGTHDLGGLLAEKEVQFVAVCDVNRARTTAAKATIDKRYGNADCAVYRDFRELLARQAGIDAMLVATGDRWHATAAIHAMRAGKDVYCEKPASLTIAEGEALVETARRYGRVFQSGIQRLSEANFIFAGELVRRGMLGKIHTVYAHLWHIPTWPRSDGGWLPAQPEPAQDELDWDLWLGPTPWRPFNRDYVNGGWYRVRDFANGIAQWGSHTICQCQYDMGLATTSPVEYRFPKTGDAEGLTAVFANGLKLVMTRDGWRGTCGIRYEGSDGWVSCADGYTVPDVSTQDHLRDYKRLVDEYVVRTGHPVGHLRDFLDAIRSRRKCVANEDVAHNTMITNHAMDICMDLKRDVKWDPRTQRFVDDEAANRLRSRAARAPWVI